MVGLSWCPSLSYWTLSPFTAVRKTVGGWFNNPISRKRWSCTFLPNRTQTYLLYHREEHYRQYHQDEYHVSNWRTAANSSHEVHSNVWKTVQHVPSNTCCVSVAIFSLGQDGNDDVMFANVAQRVIIIAMIDRHVLAVAPRRGIHARQHIRRLRRKSSRCYSC